MNLLFVHQNAPGQFQHLIRALSRDRRNRIVFITGKGQPAVPGADMARYAKTPAGSGEGHPYLHTTENAMLRGEVVARVARELRRRGFKPDLIYAHPGWGDALFLKDVFPHAPMLLFAELFHRASGFDLDVDRQVPQSVDHVFRIRARTGFKLLSLEAADWNIAPTHWQKDQFPKAFGPLISVVHDGIDVAVAAPDPGAVLTLPNGRELRPGDPVVTYVSRNLEPYRGFPVFMRTVERLCKARADVQVVIIGGDGVSYSVRHESGRPWREVMLEQVSIDPGRVHFLGRVPYDQFLTALRISAAHVYLTYPFVLSWSILEAMAAECLLIGSDTAPVREVIRHGHNGLLVDFFDPDAQAARILEALEQPDRYRPLRARARADMVAHYALDHCLRRQIGIMNAVANRKQPPTFDDSPVPGIW